MRTCWKCGQALADEIERCPACGNITALENRAAQAAKPGPAAPAKELSPVQIAEKVWNNVQQTWETRVRPVAEHPLLLNVDNWLFRHWKWLVLGAAVLVATAGGVWSLNRFYQEMASTKSELDIRLADETAKQVTGLIQEVLPEKLEWGRDVMKRRVPGRFPEELSMDIDKAKGELKFMNREKTKAMYTLLIAYHYRNTHRRTFNWEPVTFYFKKSGQHWVLTGDKWLTEWEVNFE